LKQNQEKLDSKQLRKWTKTRWECV